jgi:hypothetical protein
MRRARKVTNQSVINNIQQESATENKSSIAALDQTIQEVHAGKR